MNGSSEKKEALPEISVLMPVYNAAPFLRQSIESVLTQTYNDFELLIIDDGSQDGSSEILAGYDDQRIRIHRNVINRGLVPSLNIGIGMARGKYIARMDADDLSEPIRLERQVNYLDKHQEVGVCSTWATIIDAEGMETGATLRLATGKCLKHLFWKPSPLIHPAIMARVEILQQNPYDPNFNDAEDYELLLRLYDVTQIHNIPETLYRIRRHTGNVSVTKRDNQLETSYRAFCRFIGHEEISFEAFLALSFVDFSMHPLHRFRASLKASQRTGVSIVCLLKDTWNYFRKIY